MSNQERKIDLGGLVVTVHGQPGTGGGRVTGEANNRDMGFPEAVAADVMESVVLALHAKGVLTLEVEAALKDAYGAIENNLGELGQRALDDAETSGFARVAADHIGNDELQFDERMVVSSSDQGAYLSAWYWVSNVEVASHLSADIEREHGSLDVLKTVGIESLADAIEEMGVEEVYEKIKPLLPARDRLALRCREESGG